MTAGLGQMVREGIRTSPLRKSAQATARFEGRVNRQALWPAEARGRKVFKIRIQLIHDNRRYGVEIRSKKGGWFYAMANGRVVKGSNRREALLRLVEVLS